MSAQTLRPTRFARSAYRMARTRQLCASCAVRVARVIANFSRACRTSAAVRSLSFTAPIRSAKGVTTSRRVLTVFSERSARPYASQSSTACRTV